MLQINDNTNDELFRRAADSYPLKTDNPDWEAVLNKINAGDSSSGHDTVPKKRNKNYRFLFLLLLLIPFTIFENKKFLVNEQLPGKNNRSGKATVEKEIPGQADPGKTTNANSIQSMTEASKGTTNETINSVEPVITQTIAQKNNKPGLVTTASAGNSIAVSNKRIYLSRQKARMKIENVQPATGDESIANSSSVKESLSRKKTIPATDAIAITKDKGEEAAVEKKEASPVVKNEGVQPEKETGSSVTTVINETDPGRKDKTAAVNPGVKQPEKKITKNDERTVSKETKKTSLHVKHFYAGLVAAPDFSAIKLQSLKKIGFNYGLLVGYRLTNKISIETGLLKDRKYYSSNGKYFSTKNIYLPPNAAIEYVDGVCKMLELPINIIYTFKKGVRSGWFGLAGISSYFMQHESYVYDVNYNGYRYPKAYDYSNKSSSFLAVINISAGYTYKLGRIGDLRFEPYIKLPVNKIGTGGLPIQSAGIFIGITKNIF